MHVELARRIDADEDEMSALVADVAHRVAAVDDVAWAGLPDDQADVMRRVVERNIDVAVTEPRRTSAPPADA